MDANMKAKWVEALRSGEFKQHRGSIGGYPNPNDLCCIGVGGRVAGLKDVGIGGNNLTRQCGNVLGLSDDVYHLLWHMNDNEGKTFPEIADYIEKNL